MPVPVFMCRKADHVVGVTSAQEVDLVEFSSLVFRGVQRNAMVDRQRNVAALEEAHQIV